MLGKRKGLCINADFCSRARSNEVIIVGKNEDFHCPECYHFLIPYRIFTVRVFKELAFLTIVLFMCSIAAWWIVKPIADSRRVKSSLGSELLAPTVLKRQITMGELEKTFLGTLVTGKNKEKTVILNLRKVQKNGERIVGIYTLNLNSIEARRDSFFVVRPDERILYSGDFGELLYERETHGKKIILHSLKAGTIPYWYFEEAGN